MSSLKKLELGNNKINELPEQIGSLKYLEILSIANTPITSLPKSIVNLQQLKQIYPPDSLDYFPPELARCLSHVFSYRGIKNYNEFKDQIPKK